MYLSLFHYTTLHYNTLTRLNVTLYVHCLSYDVLYCLLYANALRWADPEPKVSHKMAARNLEIRKAGGLKQHWFSDCEM